MAIGTGAILGTLAGLGLGTGLLKKFGVLGGDSPDIENRAALQRAFAAEQERGQRVSELATQLPGAAAQRESEIAALAFGGSGAGPRGGSRQAGLRSSGVRSGFARVGAGLEAEKLRRAVDPSDAQAQRRVKMMAAMNELRAQGVNTPEAIVSALGPLTGGDPVLIAEARRMAGGGRLFQTGTAPGFVEDIGSFFGLA